MILETKINTTFSRINLLLVALLNHLDLTDQIKEEVYFYI